MSFDAMASVIRRGENATSSAVVRVDCFTPLVCGYSVPYLTVALPPGSLPPRRSSNSHCCHSEVNIIGRSAASMPAVPTTLHDTGLKGRAHSRPGAFLGAHAAAIRSSRLLFMPGRL